MINRKRLIPAISLALLFSMSAAAQTYAQNGNTQAQPKPATGAALKTNTLAIVNGQSVTLDDIDSDVRDLLNNLDTQVAEMRRRTLTNRVNALLVEAEAKKRGVTAEQLINAEVNSRIPPPTEDEIRTVYDANREQLGGATLDEARPRLIAAVREQRAAALMDDLATRLRMMYVVEWGATDVNTPNIAPSTILATVATHPITFADLNEQLKPAIDDLRLRVYEAERQAVEAKINEILLDAEAKRRRITRDDLLRIEIFDKVRQPTDADIAKFYEANRSRIEGDLSSRRAEIAAYLAQVERGRLEQALADRLRASASVRIMIPEPAGYVQKISTDDDPARGDPNAIVTVVMFTDFQCPACSATHPVLDEVLKQYGTRVRFVVRDFPLEQHQWARKAAEAADAANAQGKFFEYTDMLYRNQQALDVASLKKYASDLGLDRARFDADLDSGKFAAEVSHDVEEGKAYGVNATPTIFINGVRLLDLSDRAIKAGIDSAFERAGQKPPASVAK